MFFFFSEHSLALKPAIWMTFLITCCFGLLTVHSSIQKLYSFLPAMCWNYWGKARNLGPEFPVLFYPLCQVSGKVGHIQKSPLAMWCGSQTPPWSWQLYNRASLYQTEILTSTPPPRLRNKCSPRASHSGQSPFLIPSAAFHDQSGNPLRENSAYMVAFILENVL